MTFYYLFKQLYAQQTPELDKEALDDMRQRWEAMTAADWQCSWEDFSGGSKAHVYGMFPAYFLSSYVLGVRLDGPVWNKRILIEPHLADLEFAEGVVVTEFGLVPISWKRNGNSLSFRVEVPKGVKATFQMNVRPGETLTIDGAATARKETNLFHMTLDEGVHVGTLSAAK